MSEEERTASPFAGIAPFNLTIAMTDLLALGLPLEEVVATVTANAAKLIRMEDELGSLAVGREADVTVLDVLKGPLSALRQQRSRDGHRHADPPGVLPAGRRAARHRLAARTAGDGSGGLTGSNAGPNIRPGRSSGRLHGCGGRDRLDAAYRLYAGGGGFRPFLRHGVR